MTPKHTPTPWLIRPGTQTQIAYQVPQEDPNAPRPYKTIAETDTPERAALIVRAVSAHDYQLWALKAALPWMGRSANDLTEQGRQELHNAIEGMKAAISKAERAS